MKARYYTMNTRRIDPRLNDDLNAIIEQLNTARAFVAVANAAREQFIYRCCMYDYVLNDGTDRHKAVAAIIDTDKITNPDAFMTTNACRIIGESNIKRVDVIINFDDELTPRVLYVNPDTLAEWKGAKI